MRAEYVPGDVRPHRFARTNANCHTGRSACSSGGLCRVPPERTTCGGAPPSAPFAHEEKRLAKKVRAVVTLQLPAGKANPAPPVGPALGQHGVNIMEFCKEYNARTQDKAGQIIPAQLTIFEDRSFTFVLKTPPAADMLRKAAGIEKGSGNPRLTKVGKVSEDDIRKIAETKMPDLNANSVEEAMKIVEGTARSMGIEVV